MKATELMGILEALVAKHGDCDVGMMRDYNNVGGILHPVIAVRAIDRRRYSGMSVRVAATYIDKPDAFTLDVES
jgi:hypothetical protein